MRVVRTLAAAKGKVLTESQERNAQRTTDQIFQNYTLPVELECMEHSVFGGQLDSITTYHVTPETWVKYFVEENLAVLTGSGHPEQNLRAFWDAFRLANPTHKVFQVHKPDEMHRVLPFYLHGDEGRGQKKSPYYVVSMESPLGAVPRPKPPCSCATYLAARPHLPTFGPQSETLRNATVKCCSAMFTNYRGHSYLTRHLLFSLRHSIYRANPQVIDKLWQCMVDSFTRLLFNGVEVPRHGTFYAAVLGVKGDMDFHTKSYELNRSYSHVITRRGNGGRNGGMICFACHAGTGSQFPFDDFHATPAWSASLFRTRPWDNPWPVIANLPVHDLAPERAIVPDTLHVIKLGLARDLIGGVLLILSRKCFFDYEGSSKNITDRLQRAYSNFSLFCQVNRFHPSVRGFSKKWLHLKNFMSSPWANCKGSDSMILLKWLVWFLRLNVVQPTVTGHETLLDVMIRTCESVLSFFKSLHSHGLFLERPCANLLYIHMMRILRGYKRLGKEALSLSIRAFTLKPKAHSLHHMAHSIMCALQDGHALILSPEAESCEVNEDFIGRISKLSRRVGVRCMDRRVFQRYFLKKHALQKRAKHSSSGRK